MFNKKHFSTYLILIFVVLISVFFLWNEKLSIREKINDQKISNYFVTIFTAVGTLATIYYTTKQYSLSKEAHKASIKPDIYPEEVHCKMTDLQGSTKQFNMSVAEVVFPDAGLLIKNTGIGIAKKIQIKWDYDVSEVQRMISDIYIMTPDDKQNLIEYLNPDCTHPITLPLEYLSCFGIKLFEKYQNKMAGNVDYLEFRKKTHNSQIHKEIDDWRNKNYPETRPELNLIISYSDTQLNFYQKKFISEITFLAGMIKISFKERPD